MVMKKTLMYIFAFLFLIFLILMYIRYFSDINTIEYQIFKHERGHVLSKLLRKIPSEYKDMYKFEILKKNANLQLIYINDVYSSDGYYYYWIDFIRQKKSGMLCAPPHYRFRSNNMVTESNYMSYLIDINLFNKYCLFMGIKSFDNVIDNYIKFLYPVGHPEMVVEIRDRNDLIEVMNNWPIDKNYLDEEIIEVDHVDLSGQSNLIRYYWVSYAGLIKFTFSFNYRHDLEVNSENIGLLGNERIFM